MSLIQKIRLDNISSNIHDLKVTIQFLKMKKNFLKTKQIFDMAENTKGAATYL